MNSFLAFLFALFSPLHAQTITPTGGGTTTIVASSTAISGLTANQILESSGTVISGSPFFATNDTNGSTLASSTSAFTLKGGSTGVMLVNGPTFTVTIGGILSLINAGNLAGLDTGMSRAFPGIIAIGNGTNANTAGGIMTGTNADTLCLSATGTVLLQAAACTISSLRFKPDWAPYKDNALKKVVNMEVGTFHTAIPSKDPNSESLQAGLNAENVAKIAPECAVYEDDMKTPKSYRQECVIGLLVKAVQQLKADR